MNKTFKFIKKNPIVTAITICSAMLLLIQIIPILIMFFILVLVMMLIRKVIWQNLN